jgi:hypothetical protein
MSTPRIAYWTLWLGSPPQNRLSRRRGSGRSEVPPLVWPLST